MIYRRKKEGGKCRVTGTYTEEVQDTDECNCSGIYHGWLSIIG